MVFSANTNMYELLSNEEHIPTTKIVGIPMFNSTSTISTLILEENHDFVPSPTVESNILDHGEGYFPSRNKNLYTIGANPSHQSYHHD